MEPGTRVRHKKYGLGTVLAYYAKKDDARVEYDSGHKTTNSCKRLTPVTEAPAEQLEKLKDTDTTSKVSRRSSAGTVRVDYKLLDKVKKHFEKLFPTADRVAPKMYGDKVYAEIWSNGGAHIEFYQG